MNKPLAATAVAATLACATGTAHADANGLFVGAGVTQATVDDIFGFGSHLRINDTSWKGFVGFKPPVIPLGVEADYIDLGSQSRDFGFTTGHADAKAFAGFLIGYLPIPVPLVDLYGKVGAARWQLNGFETRPSLFSVDDRGTEFAWGIGAQFHLQQFAIRMEYENFNIRNTDGARLYTVGGAFYF
jgi:hypothetical protein